MAGVAAESKNLKTGEVKRSSDPYPVGGSSEPIEGVSIAIRQCGEMNMALTQGVLTATDDKTGSGLEIEMMIGITDGSIRFWVNRDGKQVATLIVLAADLVGAAFDAHRKVGDDPWREVPATAPGKEG